MAIIDVIGRDDPDPLFAFESEATQASGPTPSRPRTAQPSVEAAAPRAATGTTHDRHAVPEETREQAPRARIPLSGKVAIAFAAVSLAALSGVALYTAFGREQVSTRPLETPPASAPAEPKALTPPERTARLEVQSNVDGAVVSIDDEARGSTPLELTVPAGFHMLKIESGIESRSIPLTIQAGGTLSQYIELASHPAPKTGELDVASTPPGAEVRIDGSSRGRTPLVVPELAAGSHTVVIGTGTVAVTRTVRISAGATASIVAATPAPVATAGWVAFKSPIELQVYEDDRLLGSTEVDSVMLPGGAHQLELSSRRLEFQTTVPVQIAAGKVTSVNVAIPNGSLSLNALPWADVSIDGRPAGTTPLANISLPIGEHEIVFRSPTYGERRQTVLVTARTPVRLGVDLAK